MLDVVMIWWLVSETRNERCAIDGERSAHRVDVRIFDTRNLVKCLTCYEHGHNEILVVVLQIPQPWHSTSGTVYTKYIFHAIELGASRRMMLLSVRGGE